MASLIAAEKQKAQQTFVSVSPVGMGQQRVVYQQKQQTPHLQQIPQYQQQHQMGNNQLYHEIGVLRQQLIMERQERANRQRLLQESKQMLER